MAVRAQNINSKVGIKHTEPTEGSKTQKRKRGKASHVPFKG